MIDVIADVTIKGITIGLNTEFIALVLLGAFVLYFMGIIYVNTYTNFTAKDLGRLFVIVYMLGVLTVAYLVGSSLFIYISFLILVIFFIFSFLKMRGKSKTSKVAAQQGGSH
jgi:hypothetical protein